MKHAASGFTLVEVMVTVAIVGILTAVALPSYGDYVTRGRLTEAFTALGAAQSGAEQFWSNTRSFANFDKASVFPAASPNFSYALTNASPSAFLITARGTGAGSGFVYTIDQNGNRATLAAPAGWGTSATCWVDHKGGQCSQ